MIGIPMYMRVFIFVCIVASWTKLYSQQSFIHIGSEYVFEQHGFFSLEATWKYPYTEKVVADTVIGGIRAFVFEGEWECYPERIVRYNERKYQVWDVENSRFITLVDFGQNKGDTLPAVQLGCSPQYWYQHVVDSVKMVAVNGYIVKALKVTTLNSSFRYYGWLYEGIPGSSSILPLHDFQEPEGRSLRCVEDSLLGSANFKNYPCDSSFLHYYVTDIEVNAEYLDIQIFPNPADQAIYIQTESKGLIQWQLLDLFGNDVVAGTGKTVPVWNIPNAVYLLKVRAGSNMEIKKVLVHH